MTKRFLSVLLLATVLPLTMFSDARSTQEEYIRRYSKIAVSEMYRSGIPASITLAQGLLESGAGKSRLAVEGNNHFGIKCHNWAGKKIHEDDDKAHECFRKYASAEDSYRDHSDFLRYKDRYSFLFDLDPVDYKAWAYGLKKAGYATDPNYPRKLIRLIEDYRLYEYDRADEAAESERGGKSGLRRPEPPSKIERPEPVDAAHSEVFSFNLSRQLYSLNGVPFVYSVEGETYASIAKEYHLFPREILKFNDLTAPRELLPGTVVYLQAKKSKAAKGLDKHVWEKDDDLWVVSQRYGIRLSRLLKMNGVKSNSDLVEGDLITLRK